MNEEPVAYLQLDIHGKETVHIEKDMSDYETKPLYTKEQLQPKVKMTKSDFKKWNELYTEFNGKKFRLVLQELEEKFEYDNFYRRFAWNSEGIAVFANLFNDYDPDNPEETIEIVPEEKWFVRSKTTNGSYKYDYLSRVYATTASPRYGLKNIAITFDTKEEAELWTNPLTKAILLPVEDDNESN